jgi:O-antigen ligase
MYLSQITAIIFLASPVLFSYWWAQTLVYIFCLFNIHRLAKFWLFWLLLINIALFSTEPKFSLEYYLIASALFAVSLSPQWAHIKTEKKEVYFIALFAVIFVLDFFKIKLFEEGGLLLLYPFMLSYLIPLTKLNIQNPKANKAKLLVYLFSSAAMILSNKKASLLAFITSLYKSFNKKLFISIALILVAGSFLIQNKPIEHFQKSIETKLLIWQSSAKGFLEKPLFGHGFGTFALNFPLNKIDPDKHSSKTSRIINHGHSQVFHSLFENGLLGIFLLVFLARLIYKQNKIAFYSFLVLVLISVPLKSFSQFLVFGLILNSLRLHIQTKYETLILKQFKNKILLQISKIVIIPLSAVIFYPN